MLVIDVYHGCMSDRPHCDYCGEPYMADEDRSSPGAGIQRCWSKACSCEPVKCDGCSGWIDLAEDGSHLEIENGDRYCDLCLSRGDVPHEPRCRCEECAAYRADCIYDAMRDAR